ncbi:MAG: hypothetical protein WAR83_06750 [Flavobacteriales bacterium]|jgi:hypothetical protein|nr:hypothetical protein [Flavobacteriales bacterium]
MKYTLFTIALLFAGTSLMAQEKATGSVAKPAVEQANKGDIQAMAGTLKETLAMVSGHAGNANKLVEVATPENKESAIANRDKLVSTQKDLEAALTAVSNATPENWKEVKANAEATNAAAIEVATEIKGE